jgi:4-amino-4-deoxy-L-arabinose transferase-like glycosyltransferase
MSPKSSGAHPLTVARAASQQFPVPEATPLAHSRETNVWRKYLLIALVLTGAFFRLFQLDQYPLGVHQDELSNMYDGWSIATTGHDRFGDAYPGVVRAFGERDYRPALYPWLAAVSEGIGGFSITTGRLPAAIAGIASLLFLYAFARRMGGETFGILALLLATFSPLHIQFSRMAHEGGILPGFFLIVVLYLWQKTAHDGFPIPTVATLGIALGLSANIYQSTRLTAALLTVGVGIDIVRHAKLRIKPLLTLATTALLGALPQVLFLIQHPDRFAGRASVLGVRASNPLVYDLEVLRNYWLNLAPHYLFVPPMLRGLTVARLIPAEAPFFYIGLIALAYMAVRSRSRARSYIYGALLITILPAAITTDNPATMRTSAIAVLTPLFSAAGIVFVGSLVKDEVKRRRIYFPGVVGVLLVAFVAVTYRYVKSEYWRELSYQELGVRLGRAMAKNAGDYDAVIAGWEVSQSYLYIAAFTPIHPREFLALPKRLIDVGMDKYLSMGKYHFLFPAAREKSIEQLRGRRVLFVVPHKYAGMKTVDSVFFRKDTLYFQSY